MLKIYQLFHKSFFIFILSVLSFILCIFFGTSLYHFWRIFCCVLFHLFLECLTQVNSTFIGQSYQISKDVSQLISNMSFLLFWEWRKTWFDLTFPLKDFSNFAYLSNKSKDKIPGSMKLLPISFCNKVPHLVSGFLKGDTWLLLWLLHTKFNSEIV